MSNLIKPPRPKRYDEAVTKAATEKLMPSVKQWLESGGYEMEDDELREELASVLEYGGSHDGYQLARKLEDRGWEPSTELCEILDGASHAIYSAHRKLVEEWVAENNIVSPVQVGTKVKIERRGRVLDGEVVRIDAEQAEASVFCESLGHVRSGTGARGIILGFEELILD